MTHSIRLDRRFAIIDEWLLDLPVSDRAVRLYAILARYADNETHKAYPSRATLAKRLNCSLASVDRAAAELVSHRAMSKRLRANSSIVYTLHTVAPEGVVTSEEGGSSPVTRGVVTSEDLTRTTQPEPKNKNISATGIESFDRFWAAYPRRKDKGHARQAFLKAVRVTDPDLIIRAAEQFRDAPNRVEEFTPYPATWLNGERWEDEHDTKTFGVFAEVPDARAWVKAEHDRGEHWECRPGEYGCK